MCFIDPMHVGEITDLVTSDPSDTDDQVCTLSNPVHAALLVATA